MQYSVPIQNAIVPVPTQSITLVRDPNDEYYEEALRRTRINLKIPEGEPLPYLIRNRKIEIPFLETYSRAKVGELVFIKKFNKVTYKKNKLISAETAGYTVSISDESFVEYILKDGKYVERFSVWFAFVPSDWLSQIPVWNGASLRLREAVPGVVNHLTHFRYNGLASAYWLSNTKLKPTLTLLDGKVIDRQSLLSIDRIILQPTIAIGNFSAGW
ncbi:MAG: hypothetical protein ACP5T9_05895 [Thermoplasmata archaeon]